MKLIDLLVDIANNGVSEGMCFKYFDRIDKQYDTRVASLELIYYLLNYDRVDINDEIEIIEDTSKEDRKIKRIQSNGESLYSEYIGEWLIHKERYTEYDELLMNKINEIIDYINTKGE